MIRCFAAAVFLGTSLAGCDLAPPYHRPDLALPANYTEDPGWEKARPADDEPRGAWWTAFGDDGLNELETRVTPANQDLRAALARLDQAKAASVQADAALLPQVNAQAGASRARSSATSGVIRTFNPVSDFPLQAVLNYEVDLFDRIRNAARASSALELASEGDLATLDLSLHAELATDWWTLRSDDAQRQALIETVDAYQKALDLTRRRHDEGSVSGVDLDQAEAQLDSAKADLADLELRRAETLHAIAVLVGQPASGFNLEAGPLRGDVPTFAAGVPANLVERRPDVAANERRVASANAEIGVARAAFFPTLSLTGTVGLDSRSLDKLATAPSRLWSLGATSMLPVFDAGLRQALDDAARARYDEAVANYRQSVLTADQQVEDALASLRQLQREAEAQGLAAAAAARARDQALDRYRGGIDSYIDVVTAQTAELRARLAAIDAKARGLEAGVALVKALGGGWNAPEVTASAVK